MMNATPLLVQVGPDEVRLCDEELASIDWAVYWYAREGYNGRGLMVGRFRNGRFFEVNLAHCSCWGPAKDLMSWESVVPEDRVEGIAAFHDKIGRALNPTDCDYDEARAVARGVKDVLEARQTESRAHDEVPVARTI